MFCAACHFGFAQTEVKRRSFVGFRFGPDTTAVLSNDALYRGQSYAGAFKLLVGVEPLKHSKELVRMLGVKSRTVVADKKYNLALDCRLANLDDGSLTRAGVFDGIREQVGKHLPQQSWVALDGR